MTGSALKPLAAASLGTNGVRQWAVPRTGRVVATSVDIGLCVSGGGVDPCKQEGGSAQTP
jgi:hypothetical protein